jgi:hypothetical protein
MYFSVCVCIFSGSRLRQVQSLLVDENTGSKSDGVDAILCVTGNSLLSQDHVM